MADLSKIKVGSTTYNIKDETARSEKAEVKDFSGTLPATSWSGSAAPYSKAVTVNGILATDKPIIDMVASGTFATDETMISDWAKIYRVVASANTLTFYATDSLEASVPFQVRCIR